MIFTVHVDMNIVFVFNFWFNLQVVYLHREIIVMYSEIYEYQVSSSKVQTNALFKKHRFSFDHIKFEALKFCKLG